MSDRPPQEMPAPPETPTRPVTPRYAYQWAIVCGALALGAIIASTLMFAEGYPYAQAVSVTLALLCSVTVAATVVCLRQDALRVSIEGAVSYYTAIHAKELRGHLDDLYAKGMNELGGGQAGTGITEQLADFREEVERRIAEGIKRARTEAYVEGVRERLSGEGGSVVGWPGQKA